MIGAECNLSVRTINIGNWVCHKRRCGFCIQTHQSNASIFFHMEYFCIFRIQIRSLKCNLYTTIGLNLIAICIIQGNISSENVHSFLIVFIQFQICCFHHQLKLIIIIYCHCLNVASLRNNTVSCRQSDRYAVGSLYLRCQHNAGIHRVQLI